MAVYTAAAGRMEVIGAENVRWDRGTIFVATHRSERDVPLICAALYLRAGLWRQRRARLRFAARDDMFAPGFLAGFPPGLPPRLRRMLAGVSLERGLRRVRAHPLPSATTMRLGAALAALPPDRPLDGLLPQAARERLRVAAARAGLPEPRTAAAALRGDLADALWEQLTAEDLDHPEFADAWRRRASEARAGLRGLVEALRAGHPLLLFPEGRPSPDGAVGPLRRGLGALVRRGEARWLLPVGISYDPLTCGRPRAVAAFLPALPAGGAGPDQRALEALRRALPLTCDQAVAGPLLAAARDGEGAVATSALERAAAGAVAAARAAGRPVERDLGEPGARRARLAECLRALAREGAVRPGPGGAVALEPARLLAHPALARAEIAHRSAAGR